MEHLLDFLSEIVLTLPSDYRTLMILMIMAIIMLASAMRISRASRGERLPLGASSGPVQSNRPLWFPLILSLSKDTPLPESWFDRLTTSG